MTTEFADEDEPSIQLPSFEGVQNDLKRVRQKEGASVRRISDYGQNLQQLRISQDEFRRSGSQPGTLPMATITALECAVRTFEPESVHFTVLDTTLNFRGAPANLTDRQQTVMDTLEVLSKTTYELYEKNSYELFAYRIQQQAKSFCGQPESPAVAIAKLPFEQRVAFIQVLLDARLSLLPVNRNVLAEDVLRALPGLATVPPLDGMAALQKVDRAIAFMIRSERYAEARQANTAVPEAAFQINAEIARRYRQRGFFLSGDKILASLFDRVVGARLRDGDNEIARNERLLKFGELSEFSERDVKRLAADGPFSEHGEPTPRFDLARFEGIGFLASLLVEIEQANDWKELFGQQLHYTKPEQPPPRFPESKKPNRPKKTGDSWESDS